MIAYYNECPECGEENTPPPRDGARVKCKDCGAALIVRSLRGGEDSDYDRYYWLDLTDALPWWRRWIGGLLSKQ